MRNRTNSLIRSDGEFDVSLIGRNHHAKFVEGADLLIAAYEHRKQHPDRYSERSNDWFKRNVYRFLKEFIDRGNVRVFELAIMKSERRKDALDRIRDNPFKLGLFAMYADASFPRTDRNIFGNQMLYAYRHGVSPELFVGFIRSAGSPTKITWKLKNGYEEPGF